MIRCDYEMQRSREIYLWMTLCSRRCDIHSQFLFEALFLGFAGSSIGVFLGLGLPLLSRLFIRSVAIQVSAASALLAFLFSCAIAVVFGVVPALRASQLNPTEALHHE